MKTAEIEIDTLVTTKNYRGMKLDEAAGPALESLAASIRKEGVLQPILVRTRDDRHEVVDGHRRLAAAKLAGLTVVPAMIRTLTDEQALKAQLIANDEREDAHPLDQAHAYKKLAGMMKTDAAGVADSVGRPQWYVYDRLRLLELTPEAQTLFREGTLHLAHAIILARLRPKDQERALRKEYGGVFEPETNLLFGPDQRETSTLKLRTARQLQSWVDKHIRLDTESPVLPQLFPATAAALADATAEKRKVVPITYQQVLADDARDQKERTYGPQSWKRADGEKKSKPCTHAILGVVIAGPDRGVAFDVCVNKKKCEVHWPDQVRAAKRKGKAAGKPTAAGAKKKATAYDKAVAAQRERERISELERQRWTNALPDILPIIKHGVSKMRPAGPIGDVLIKRSLGYGTPGKVLTMVKRGKTADDLVVYLAWLVLACNAHEYGAYHSMPKALKKLGIDVAPALKKHPLVAAKAAVPGVDVEVEEGADGDED